MASANAKGSDSASLPPACLTQWQEHFRRGNLPECVALAGNWVRTFPDAGKAWQLLGAALLTQGNAAEALPALRRASELAPGDWSVWDNLAIARQRHGDFAGASAAFAASIELAPAQASVRANASLNALQAGDAGEALQLAREAIERSPRLAIAHLNAGNALSALGRGEEAESAFRTALAIQPVFGEALLSLGRELGRRGDVAAAVATTQRALALNPRHADAHLNLAHYFNTLGDIAAAARHYRRAHEENPQLLAAGSGELFCLLHDDRLAPDELAAAHRRFGERVEAPWRDGWVRHPNVADPQRRLRLGFVSGDLRNHPVARFLEPVWRLLDRTRFELVAFDVQPGGDEIATRLRRLADDWIDASNMSDTQLDGCIRARAIDILFDLSGHTARNRMGVFARRPAPLQISWLGYPATTGLSAIDYRFVDATAAPPGRFDHLFSEHLAYLPYLSVFERPADLPPVAPAPSLRSARFTFGSFNRVNKLGSRSLDLWTRVLLRARSTRLLIAALPNDAAGVALRRHFTDAGIAPDRLEFRQRLGLPDYLALHGEVDLLLDTVPFSSGTTANFALWMGVPTLTLAGDSFTERLGACRMAAVGLDAFIAESEDEYVERAAEWPDRGDELARLRGNLRARVERQSREQPEQLVQALQAQLRAMWQRWCDGLPAARLQ